jgi:hypothetical protein
MPQHTCNSTHATAHMHRRPVAPVWALPWWPCGHGPVDVWAPSSVIMIHPQRHTCHNTHATARMQPHTCNITHATAHMQQHTCNSTHAPSSCRPRVGLGPWWPPRPRAGRCLGPVVRSMSTQTSSNITRNCIHISVFIFPNAIPTCTCPQLCW